MTSTGHRDSRTTRDPQSGELPDLVFEIHTAKGINADRLAIEQARVLWEVMQWLAQKNSASGQDRAA
jgi:hypothetical protein